MTVEYDGTHFLGFQRQAQGRTVQAVLEAALAAVSPMSRVVAAGRTDAGVHASGQVVHFTYAGRVPVAHLPSVLNARLPDDLAIRECLDVGPTFHARYSALSRLYRYNFLLAETRQPLRERYAWRLAGHLDFPAMAQAAGMLLGTHSFRHFGNIPGNAEQRRRSLAGHGWRRTIIQAALTGEADNLCLHIEADAFLTHMVRAIVGALVAVGRGRLPAARLQAALQDERSDTPLAPLAPPHGLCLVRVRYPRET